MLHTTGSAWQNHLLVKSIPLLKNYFIPCLYLIKMHYAYQNYTGSLYVPKHNRYINVKTMCTQYTVPRTQYVSAVCVFTLRQDSFSRPVYIK